MAEPEPEVRFAVPVVSDFPNRFELGLNRKLPRYFATFYLTSNINCIYNNIFELLLLLIEILS